MACWILIIFFHFNGKEFYCCMIWHHSSVHRLWRWIFLTFAETEAVSVSPPDFTQSAYNLHSNHLMSIPRMGMRYHHSSLALPSDVIELPLLNEDYVWLVKESGINNRKWPHSAQNSVIQASPQKMSTDNRWWLGLLAWSVRGSDVLIKQHYCGFFFILW